MRGERGIHQLHSPEWRVQRTALGFRGREASADFSRHPVRLRRAVFRAHDIGFAPSSPTPVGIDFWKSQVFAGKKTVFRKTARDANPSDPPIGASRARAFLPRLPDSCEGREWTARDVSQHTSLYVTIRDTRYVSFDASWSVSRQSLRPRFNPVLTRTARATPSAPSPPPRAAAFRARSS